MSDRNNQGSGNAWAWIIGTGVAAVAGAVVAIMATNTEPTRTEYIPAPRRRRPPLSSFDRPPSLQRLPSLQRPPSLPPPSSATSASQKEYDFDDASSTSSLGEEVDGQSQECPICLRRLVNRAVRELTCGHLFHSYCINTWLDQTNDCPLCRRVVSPQQLPQ